MCNLQKNHWEGSRSITENMIQQNRPALPPFAILTIPKEWEKRLRLSSNRQVAMRTDWSAQFWLPGALVFSLPEERSAGTLDGVSALGKNNSNSWEAMTAVSPTLLSVSPASIDSNEVMFPKWRSQWIHKTTSLCNSNPFYYHSSC